MEEQAREEAEAPTHRDYISLLGIFLLCLVPLPIISFIAHHYFGSTAAIGAAVFSLAWAFVVIAFIRRKHDRIGWHERKPIETPQLPFKTQGWLTLAPLNFEADHIAWGWRDKIPYREISRVEVHCMNDYFSGITVHTANHGKKSFQNFYPSGEPARTMIRVLRQQAPHAQFDGPSWIEQGWVPRLGFRHPTPSG